MHLQMANKIKSITEKVPKDASLPDGDYYGIWGGYVIEVTFKGKTYELTTEEGVRGVGFRVVVHVSGDSITFNTLQN